MSKLCQACWWGLLAFARCMLPSGDVRPGTLQSPCCWGVCPRCSPHCPVKPVTSVLRQAQARWPRSVSRLPGLPGPTARHVARWALLASWLLSERSRCLTFEVTAFQGGAATPGCQLGPHLCVQQPQSCGFHSAAFVPWLAPARWFPGLEPCSAAARVDPTVSASVRST